MQSVLTQNVAIYCRLSREDENSLESVSIKNQKEMLSEFALKNGWNIFDIYIDDGYSGGTFNRPAFNRLIDDIEKGFINILLTKDLSRLGRNYIEAGYYTEEYFPSKNVRFIAVNDNYDSTSDDNDFTPFKNIINQWYLKDISKKVKSANLNRIKKGLLPRGNHIPLYGYKNDGIGGRVIDEETAPIVRLIFKLYSHGMNKSKIASYLYEHKVYSIGYYNYTKYGYDQKSWFNVPEDKKYMWTPESIRNIISNKQYTGALILQKRKTISYKSHKRILASPDETYVFEDKFPPIVSYELYELANKIKNERKSSKVPEDINVFSNLLYCESCGKALSYQHHTNNNNKKKPRTFYICRNKECKHHAYININTVHQIVMTEVKRVINLLLSHEEELREYASNYNSHKNTYHQKEQDKQIHTLIERNNKLEKLIKNLFEKNVAGDIPSTVFQKMNREYVDEFEKNSEKINSLKNKKEHNSQENNEEENKKFLEYLKDIKNQEITMEVIRSIVSKIIINKKENSTLEIKIQFYKCSMLIEGFLHEKEL